MERVSFNKSFENALKQCHEVMKNFEGSEETLKHIRQIEESLKRIMVPGNSDT